MKLLRNTNLTSSRKSTAYLMTLFFKLNNKRKGWGERDREETIKGRGVKNLGAGRSVDKPNTLLREICRQASIFPWQVCNDPKGTSTLRKFDTCHVCDEQRNYSSDTWERHHCPRGSQVSRWQADHMTNRKSGLKKKRRRNKELTQSR